MEMTRAVLVLGLVLMAALDSDAQPHGPQAEDCCFSFFPGAVPSHNILRVEKTGPDCPQQGFIVTTRKFPRLCVREVNVKVRTRP